MSALGNPQDQLRTVHVAGTNGKGSVSTLIAAGLLASGYRVGQFVSPHLSDVCERCLIDGAPIERGRFEAAVSKVLSVSQKLTPSFFEVVSAASFLCFREMSVDWAIVEVGLGGRLDATNVIACPELAVVTSIGLDHMHVLGETIEEIAREKAGIFKQGSRAITLRSAVDAVLREVALDAQCSLEFVEKNSEALSTQVYIPEENRQLAQGALSRLGVTEEAQRRGFLAARWPGRFEVLSDVARFPVILDVAHNVPGMEQLSRYLRAMPSLKRLSVLFAALSTKDWRGMIGALEALGGGVTRLRWFFTESPHRSAVAVEELQNAVPGSRTVDRAEALDLLDKELDQDETLLITGSIYLVGALRRTLVKEPFRTYKP